MPSQQGDTWGSSCSFSFTIFEQWQDEQLSTRCVMLLYTYQKTGHADLLSVLLNVFAYNTPVILNGVD